MLVPGELDLDTATDEEILTAYAAAGFDDDYARFVIEVVRGRIEPVD